jgi:ribulose-phosphate 3-epimerase
MNRNIELAPSLLSANFANLQKDIKLLETCNIKRLHLDVMDGHFVPNITIGPVVIKDIRKITNMFLETHLMITSPHKYFKAFKDAGSDMLIFHIEAIEPVEIDNNIQLIKNLATKVGISIKPKTCWEVIKNTLDKIDSILIMTVEPGFGGQEFMPDMTEKIQKIANYKHKNNLNFDIIVDGGINQKTISTDYKAGANICVVGNGIFKYENLKEGINIVRSAIETAE